MEVPGAKTDSLQINMANFRCVECSGVAPVASATHVAIGDSGFGWHRPASYQSANQGFHSFQLGYKSESQFVSGQLPAQTLLTSNEGIRVVSF